MSFAHFQTPFNVVRYALYGDTMAKEYFLVDPISGVIYQRKSIQNEPTKAKQYRVSLNLILQAIPVDYEKEVKTIIIRENVANMVQKIHLHPTVLE